MTPDEPDSEQQEVSDPNICETCQACFRDILVLEDPDAFRRDITYHTDVSHLEQSADRGCDLCRTIYQCLVLEWGTFEYRRNAGPLISSYHPVSLSQSQLGGFDSNINVEVRVGDFTLELVDAPKPSTLSRGVDVHSRTREPKPIQVTRIVEIDQHTTPIFDLIQSWLDQCCSEHQSCAYNTLNPWSRKDAPRIDLAHRPPPNNSLSPFLPTRLLAIGSSSAQPSIQLVLTSNIVGPKPRYTTLSYKWGDQHAWGGSMAHVTTTPSNYHSHLTSIDFTILPATFRHAIWTSLRLGIKYIWIDALCIIQPSTGDSSDWDREASTMCDIYMHSTLNIAATGSDSVFEGLFFERKAMRYAVAPVRVDHLSEVYVDVGFPLWINPRQADFGTLVEDSPLATRGWVMQERFLAPRTVHFTKQCVFWSCRTQTASEYNTGGKRLSDEDGTGFEWLNWSHLFRDGFSLEDAWKRIVCRYSRLRLTQTSDKLPAVAGLASLYSRATGDEYLAGIWKEDLMHSLSWKTEIIEIDWASVKQKHGRIAGPPSWSWASISAEVEFAETRINQVAWPILVVDVKMRLKSEENPLGQVLGGSLKAKGWLKIFRFSRDELFVTKSYRMSMVEGNEGHSLLGSVVSNLLRLNLDEPSTVMDWMQKEDEWFAVPCLRLGVSRTRHRNERGNPEGTHEQIYLGLKKVEGSSGNQYQRIGLLNRNINCHHEENSRACDALDTDGAVVEIEII